MSERLTASEAAELVGIHPANFMLYARQGRAPQHVGKQGRAFVWDRAEVLEWAATRKWRRKPGTTPPPCRAPGCERASWAKGFCLRHYKQERGRGLDLMRVGDPDGYGQWGVLDDDGSTVLCHECGRRLAALGYHLRRRHDLTPDDYRDAHGLPRGLALVSSSLRTVFSQAAKQRVGSPEWQRFAAACDPKAASHARDKDAFDALSRSHRLH